MDANPLLRRENRIKTIHSSLAIENNSLSLEQVTAIIDGKRVLGPPSEIVEVKNAFEVYNLLLSFNPYSIPDMLKAHKILMDELNKEAGVFRSGGVGVFDGQVVIHMAPPTQRVPELIGQLLFWAEHSSAHPLIKSCVFHYEFEFIHPFADGNGRMGRMWQTLLLYQWKKIFAWLPVETLIRERQSKYYNDAISVSTKNSDSAPFIEFLLQAILDTLSDAVTTAQVSDQVNAQVKLLLSKLGQETLSARDLMFRLGLRHRQNFQKNYLRPALELKMIELTIPDKPNSSKQKYRRASF
jgi:Fic family protein